MLLPAAVGSLTPRQQHIVAILGETDTLAEAAERLGLAPSALSARLRGIADRLHLARPADLVALARRHQILDACDDAIYGLGPDGVCVFANRAMVELFGYSEQELVGSDLHELIHHTRRDGTPFPREHCPITTALVMRRRAGGDAELFWHRDGTERWGAWTAVPTAQSDNGVCAIVSMRNVTSGVEAAESARVSAEALALALEVTGSVAFDVDLATGATRRSHDVAHLLDPALAPGPSERGTFLALVHPDDRARLERCRDMPVGSAMHDEFRVVLPGGEERRFEGHARLLAGANGHPRLLGIAMDVTERHHQQRARQLVLDTSTDAFIACRAGAVISDWNAAAEVIFGYPRQEAIAKPVVDLLVPARNRDAISAAIARIEAEAPAEPVSHGPVEMTAVRADGTEFPVEMTFTIVPSATGIGFAAFLRDITARKRMQQELVDKSVTDRLTGLPNRAILTDRLSQEIPRARRDSPLAVLCVGVDHLNTVNNSLGYPVGDHVLLAVAERLAAAVRPTDTLARFREDCFAVLRESTREHEAIALAQQLLDAVQQPVHADGREVHVRASIGINLVVRAGQAPDLALRDANAAMQRAKDHGGGRAELVDATVHERAVTRLDFETGLHHAVEHDQLRLHYQPVVDLGTGDVAGVEALLRWEHPERGLVMPADFVPVAEETGAIVPIGRWALEAACRQLALWRGTGTVPLSELTMAVNLSGLQLAHPGFVEFVAATIDAHGLDPAQLCLEITESMLMDEPVATFTMRSLHAMGVRLAIDDFGTGYSSLLSIRRFPVHILKLDQAFVAGLGRRPDDTSIVRATIDLAHALGLQAVAEGVQSQRQADLLRGMGCDLGQGHLWSTAGPADDIAPFLTRRWPARLPHVLAAARTPPTVALVPRRPS